MSRKPYAYSLLFLHSIRSNESHTHTQTHVRACNRFRIKLHILPFPDPLTYTHLVVSIKPVSLLRSFLSFSVDRTIHRRRHISFPIVTINHTESSRTLLSMFWFVWNGTSLTFDLFFSVRFSFQYFKWTAMRHKKPSPILWHGSN